MAVLALAFLLRLAPMLAWHSVSRADEIFQALEPAHRLVTGWGLVSWEWRDGIRSWMFPGAIAAIMAVARAAGLGTYGTLGAVAAVMALLSLVPVGVAYAVGWRRAGLPGAVLCSCLCAVWPDLVYFGPRTLTEVQGGHLLILAAGLAELMPRSRESRQEALVCGCMGLALGLAFCLRFHLAPALLAVAAWRCRGRWRNSWIPLLGAAALPVLIAGALDWWIWGSPFQSVWKNVVVNVIEGRSLQYGTSPAWWYVTELEREWGAAFLALLACFIIGVRREPLFAGLSLLIVGSHMLLAHKETSFIYGAVPLILIVAGSGCCDLIAFLVDISRSRLGRHRLLVWATAGWVSAAILVAAAGGFRGRWTPSGTLWAESELQSRPDLCGVGIYRLHWTATGGYSHLDRAVPITLIDGEAQLPRTAPAVNYLVTLAEQTAVPGFSMDACRFGVCLLKARRTCDGLVVPGVNSEIEQRGE